MPFILEIGETLSFPSPPNEKITLSEKNIISLQEKTNSILIQAQSKGQLTLTQGSSQKHIYVVENKEGWQLFFEKISKDPWLRLEFSQNKIQIQGQLYRFKTWKYLSFLSQKHSIPYLFKAQIPIEIQNQAHEYFKKQINQSFEIQWNSPVTVQIPSNFEKEYLFSSFGFSITQDKNIITLLPLVEIKILVTQVTENLSKNIALHPEFTPESSEPITTPQPKTFNLNSLTQLAEKIAEFYRGSARGDIISSSQTIVESGQTIDYLFGGEVPVHQTHLETLSTSIDWKPYGLRLKLSPTVHQKKFITLKISSDISELDHAYSSKGSPATKTFRWETTFTLKDGQTLPLSQLTRSQKGKFISKTFSLLNLAQLFNIETGNSKDETKAIVLITLRIIQRS